MTSTALEFADVLSSETLGRLERELERLRSVTPGNRVIAVANQKGGAGKTTTASTLGAVWAAWGLRVRLVDADPQLGSLSFWLPPQRVAPDLRAVYFDEATLDQATVETSVPGLFLVASDKTLGQVEYANLADANLAMRSAIRESTPVDITLLDCRPSLGVLTVSQLAAADEILIPLGASGLDLPGLMELAETLETVKRRLNPGLRVSAVVVCHDSETKLSRKVRNQLEEDYPDAIHWRIRRSVRVEEAPFAHEPLTTFAPDVPATQEYIRLAAELLLRGSVVTA